MKKSPCKNEEQEMAHRILSYLNRNRQAKDTLEGVKQWILEEEIRRISRARIETVVESLVNEGWLQRRERWKKKKGQSELEEFYYGLNKNKADQLEAYLEQIRRSADETTSH